MISRSRRGEFGSEGSKDRKEVKSETRILLIDLVVCGLEKVTLIKKPLIRHRERIELELNQELLRNCNCF